MRTVVNVAVFLLLGIAGLFLGTLITAPFYNSLKLHQMERVFQKIYHPEGARILSIHSAVGILSGNGNHCDFFVGSVLEVPEGTDVQAFYAGQCIAIPFDDAFVALDIVSFMKPAYSGLSRAEIPT